MDEWPKPPSEKMIRRAAIILSPFIQYGRISEIGEVTKAVARALQNERLEMLNEMRRDLGIQDN